MERPPPPRAAAAREDARKIEGKWIRGKRRPRGMDVIKGWIT